MKGKTGQFDKIIFSFLQADKKNSCTAVSYWEGCEPGLERRHASARHIKFLEGEETYYSSQE